MSKHQEEYGSETGTEQRERRREEEERRRREIEGQTRSGKSVEEAAMAVKRRRGGYVPVVQQDVRDPHLAGGEADGLNPRVVLLVPHQVDICPVLQGRG